MTVSRDVFDTVEEYWDRSDAVAALHAAHSSQTDPIREFEEAFANFVGGLDAAFLATGREAIFQALRILNVGEGDQVILPAFVCSVVADAVLRANAIPVLVDVELPGGQIDLTLVLQSLSPKTRAILIPHLYGVPVDFREIKEELEQRGIAIIEDCAHCLGGAIGEDVPGSLGTFSVFSFNYDKPISLGHGGMLVCSDPGRLNSFKSWQAQRRQHATGIGEEVEAIEEFLDWLAVRRSQIRQIQVPRGVPIGRWLSRYPTALHLYARVRRTRPPDYSFNQVGAVRACLGLSLLRQYPQVVLMRNQNAERLQTGLCDCNWGETYTLSPDIQPAHSRLNVFAGGITTRQVDHLATQLCHAGFRAGRFNWSASLDEIPYLAGRLLLHSRLHNAHKMAGHCLNLPIHQNMGRNDIDRMVRILQTVKA